MHPHPRPAPSGLSTGRKIFLGVGGTTIVVLLVAIARVVATPSGDDPGSDSEQMASSAVQDQSPSPSSPTREPQSQPAQDEEEPEDTLGIGDSFEVDGFSVTVDEVRVSTDPVQDNIFDESHSPDGKWVIVKYTVTNIGDDPQGWYQTVRIRTDEGSSYSEDYGIGTALSYEETGEVVLDINPDDSTVHHAAVDIPEDAEPDQAEFPDAVGNHTAVSLDD